MGINQGPISLDQKYTQGSGHVFLTGIQALVRLPMTQIHRDRAAGLNTAGFIAGYRGSPLGGYDLHCRGAKAPRAAQHQSPPGVNEDLAATAIWGTQQLNLSPGASMTACSASGTARAPASTAPATCSSTATPPARRKTRRRAVPRRRRPRRQILHRPASDRPRLHLRADALSLSVERP